MFKLKKIIIFIFITFPYFTHPNEVKSISYFHIIGIQTQTDSHTDPSSQTNNGYKGLITILITMVVVIVLIGVLYPIYKLVNTQMKLVSTYIKISQNCNMYDNKFLLLCLPFHAVEKNMITC